jgi:two-component system sensor histidine kinase YcbA
MIFEPGYSTNYDPKTGKMSTGIGMSQVKYLVHHVLKGQIKIESILGSGTSIHITYPLKIQTIAL